MSKPTIVNLVASLSDLQSLKQEHFICLSLDSANRLIEKHTVFIGTLTGVIAHPRDIFARAIADNAAAIIVAHNHPSGDPSPSDRDIQTTQQLIAAGQILGIPLKDHLIIAKDGYFSFRAHGMLQCS